MNLDANIHDAIIDWEEPFDPPVYYIIPCGLDFPFNSSTAYGVLVYRGNIRHRTPIINWFGF